MSELKQLNTAQRNSLDAYLNLLFKWNKKFSLISKNYTKERFIDDHISDCLFLAQVILTNDPNSKVLDVGTGAGLPGIVLSIMGVEKLVLIDRNQKKVSFLRMVINELKLSGIEVICGDVVGYQDGEISCITSKAVGSVGLLLDLCQNLTLGKKLYLLKNKDQLQEAQKVSEWLFNLNIIENRYKSGNVILELSDIKRNDKS